MKPRLLAAAAALLVAASACSQADGAASPADSPAAPGQRAAELPTSAAGGFSLYDLGSTWRDQRGDTLALAQLAGRIRVVALVYTSCHTACPAIVADMKRIETAIPAERRGDVGFVLISLDPARDTPGRLAEWADENKLDQARWTLLNGSDDAVREFAASLDIRYQTLPDGEVAHANVITVLDTTGAVVHQQVTLGPETASTAALVNRLLHAGNHGS